ncbi:tetratricopeptide repeat protein [Agromyces seonyuensis]|nr:tetratricopeptide repeat protein [Agromyces seonyuensis]
MNPRIGGAAAALLAATLVLSGCTDSTQDAPDSAGPSATSSAGAISVDDLVQLGIASANAGETDQAKATFENVLALDPGNAFANYNLGVLAQQNGDADAAMGYYDKAIETDPAFTSAMYNKAILLEDADQDAAVALYRQIVSLDDQAATAYYRLSSLLEAQGDAAGAAEARERALAIDPTLTDAPASDE